MDDGSATGSRSVLRALRLLVTLSAADGPVSLSDLARSTGLAKSTVHHLLATLRAEGFVVQDPTNDRYQLGLMAAQLGARALATEPLVAALSPGMHRLAAASGEAVSLGIRVDRSVVFVKRYETMHRLSTNITVGSSMPLYASASGKCLLASMGPEEIIALYPEDELPSQSTRTIRQRSRLLEEVDEVRRVGFARNTDEWLDGVSAVAAPVRLGDEVVAALSIAGPTMRFRAQEWLDDLLVLVGASPQGAQPSRRAKQKVPA
jgi:IclR family acetate operon transcriptional repressor